MKELIKATSYSGKDLSGDMKASFFLNAYNYAPKQGTIKRAENSIDRVFKRHQIHLNIFHLSCMEIPRALFTREVTGKVFDELDTEKKCSAKNALLAKKKDYQYCEVMWYIYMFVCFKIKNDSENPFCLALKARWPNHKGPTEREELRKKISKNRPPFKKPGMIHSTKSGKLLPGLFDFEEGLDSDE
jgi:hypothetical protein